MIKMKTIEIAVGAFVIAGIASLLMLALQVSGLNHFFQEEKGYKIQADFENIGGLKVRAKVSVAGVVIGRVTNVTLDQQSFNARVTIAIDPSKSEKFPIDTQASIMTSGLLGDNYIALVPGFSKEVLGEGGQIPIENTTSALNLEKLVSKFVANQASGETAQTTQGLTPQNTSGVMIPNATPVTVEKNDPVKATGTLKTATPLKTEVIHSLTEPSTTETTPVAPLNSPEATQ